MSSYFKWNRMMRWSAVGLLVLGLVAGCKSTPEKGSFAEVPGLTGQPAAADPSTPTNMQPAVGATPAFNTNKPTLPTGRDLLAEGESIEVVFGDLPFPMQPIKERIKDDGTITLMENQSFTAAGKTRGDLEREIRERYVPKYFLRLTVTVTPTDRFYYVGGEVKIPQRQVYVGPITVMRAIQSCGDFTDFADKAKVRLTRQDGTTVMVNAKKAIQDHRFDPEVFPGDRIHVPRTIW